MIGVMCDERTLDCVSLCAEYGTLTLFTVLWYTVQLHCTFLTPPRRKTRERDRRTFSYAGGRLLLQAVPRTLQDLLVCYVTFPHLAGPHQHQQ